MADLGEDFGGGLTAAEVDYLVRREWARTRRGHPLAALEARASRARADAAARIDAYLSTQKRGRASPPNKTARYELCERHSGAFHGQYVGAIDQGTTSTRFIVFDHAGAIVSRGAEASTSRSTRSRAMSSMTRSRSGATPRP